MLFLQGVSDSAGAWGSLGHYNILHVTTRDPGQHWFTRYCCYAAHCYKLNVNFPYPAIRNQVTTTSIYFGFSLLLTYMF